MRTLLPKTWPARIVLAETLRQLPARLLRLLALSAIVALAAGLRFTNLAALGYANHYYTAAVASMLQSWHNFFYVAAEPGGAVSVDKPPLGLWIQTISAYFFGVNGFAVLLPEIIAGLLSIILIYHLVRRSFGTAAGLLAALTLAITPIVVATDRNNTIDSLLILTLLLAAWAFMKATETSRLRYLLIGAVLVGLGFNIKMLQAFLPLPAFYALYFFGTNTGLRRRITNLVAVTVLLLVVSLSWAVAVDLTPADQRPYVGSSGNNSVLSLALGYNGIERLLGMGPGGGMRPSGDRPQPGAGFNGSPAPFGSGPSNMAAPPGGGPNGALPPGGGPGPGGPGGGGGFMGTGQAGVQRLFTTPLSKEVSWLLPFGLVSAGLLGFRARLRWPLTPRHQALVLWGGWLLIGGVFFSVAQFFHQYYLSMLGAPLAALVGIGVMELWRLRRQHPWLALSLLLVAADLTLGLQYFTAATYVSSIWWLPLVVGLFAGGVGLLVFSAKRQPGPGAVAGFACIIAALLLTPGIWSGLTALEASANQSLPSAYGGDVSGPPRRLNGYSGRPGGLPPQSLDSNESRPAAEDNPERPGGSKLQLNQKLLDYLQTHTQGMTYLMAVPSSMQGADYVIATGRPVLYIGGFNGVDQVVNGDDLAQLVSAGKLRYIYWGGREGGPPGGGPGGQSEISTWVAAHCTPVEGFETATRNFGAPDGIGQTGLTSYGPTAQPSGGMQVALYDCDG